MTAIQKMVRWLEQEINIKVEDPEDNGYLVATTSALRYANRLAAEEAKEKPTAQASLVEELMSLSIVKDKGYIHYTDIVKICSHYRPQPDVVGELKHACDHHSVENEYGVLVVPVSKIEEIIRKVEEGR